MLVPLTLDLYIMKAQEEFSISTRFTMKLIDQIRDPSNPYWPLPLDYGGLTADGKKQARLATLRRQNTPEDLVAAWFLFRNIYLRGSEKTRFYKDGHIPSPEFHSDMVYDLGQFSLNAWAAPRGSAKSTVITLEIPMLIALTRPYFDISLFFATDKLKQPRFDTLMSQFTENELILGDFGTLKPKRGAATWNHEYLQLLNGSSISGGSVMGRMRGGRPRLLILDDPENDPDSDSETSRMQVIEKFEVILFKKMIPMLKPGTQMFWIGTLIDRKAFLYRAVAGDDPRFDYWNRKILRAIAYEKGDRSKYHLLWPAMWSKEFLDAQAERIGASAFASEYMNEPISAQDRILLIDPRKNEYTVEGEFDWDNPLANTNKTCWQERIFTDDCDKRTYEEMEMPFHELVRPMFKILLFDYACGLTRNSDYSCIAVCGFDKLGTMWPLHIWLGREREDTLMRLIYEKGLAWQVRILGIEAISIQKSFVEALQEYMSEQEEVRGDQWRGRVFPITYPAKESKAQRIGSLEWRFNSGRIKYPAHLREEWPYNQLYAQTNDFTMDLALLQHDDVVDTLGMSKHIIKTRGGKFKRERGRPDLKERILKNIPIAPGIPLLSGIPINKVDDEIVNILSHRARERRIDNPRLRRIERKRPKIIR